ncbi:hypothetical protein CF642_38315, partial [Burkholderia pseudomallei]
MSDVPQYRPAAAGGGRRRALGSARVVAANAPGFAEGDLVQGLVGWQDYAHVRVVLPADEPLHEIALGEPRRVRRDDAGAPERAPPAAACRRRPILRDVAHPEATRGTPRLIQHRPRAPGRAARGMGRVGAAGMRR